MAELIHNPRRAPRIPVRCEARIAVRSGSFFSRPTVDLGPGGCGLELPRRGAPGERVFVELRDARLFGSHMLTGQIAWASEAAPWRCGVAFDPGSKRAAEVLFQRLREAYPDLASGCVLVASIPADAVLAPTPVPGTLAVVAGQAEVLSALGEGAQARALRERLGARWGVCTNALFALVGSRAVEIRGA